MSALLEARSIGKRYPGVVALDDVSLNIAAGEVVAVVGENGAGKSTLMKILAGVTFPDTGEVHLDGRPIAFKHVRDALAAGVILIHQELNLAGPLSVADNLFLGQEPSRFGLINWSKRAAEAKRMLARVRLDMPLTARVGDLPLGQQQLIEIARALGRSARVLIMDEPTSSLSPRETETLMAVIGELRRNGVAVLYISHRLPEVEKIADRVVVLRDGKCVGNLTRHEINRDAMVRLMIGRDLQHLLQRPHAPPTQRRPILEVEQDRQTLRVGHGEIVGLAGLVGAGRTELLESLFGLRPNNCTIRMDGTVVTIRSPADAIRRGLLLAPEDRRRFGLILGDSVQRNLSLPNLDLISILRFIVSGRETNLAQRLVNRLRVKTPRLGQAVGLLSGGNQQKVVLGRWLARQPRILMLDEPTRGVDVGARGEIYSLMEELAGQGVGILMASSDMEEVLGVSHRVVVMHQGAIAGELAGEAMSEEAVMRLATG